ncbi:uncharacterized protein [Dysidea avara]|uniref:uncharacterized protein n=1 Tax=Dysidea avara TaxID=196820 RepID=UPI0033246418
MFYFLDPLKHSDLASNALASFRDYFVLRQEKGIDDSLLLDDYKIIQIKSRIQYDDYNCGVLSLKKLNLKETRSEIGIELLQQSVDLSDLCVMCGSADLYDNWVKCTQCQCWQHTECVNEVISDNFLCCTCTRL